MDSKAFGRDTERFFWFCCSECISVTANASALRRLRLRRHGECVSATVIVRNLTNASALWRMRKSIPVRIQKNDLML